MDFAAIENLIASRLGFDIDSIGRKAVGTALSRSMAESGCADPQEFAVLLARDPGAWHRLVDRLVVTESWFFRDTLPFDLAVNHARAHISRVPHEPLRILTCPCSTGEEPYSLVMAMLAARISRNAFVVEAVDVNRRALEAAREASFNSRSFRGDSLEYRAAHFDRVETDKTWRLHASIRSLVRFREGNLVDPDFLKDDARYDLVFCRNLLIYLLPEARLLAIHALQRLLLRDGVLFVGNTEAPVLREHGFASVGPAGAFAFKRGRSKPVAQVASVAHRVAPLQAPHAPAPAATSLHREQPAPAIHATARDHRSDLSLLEAASKLGDAGELVEALNLCGEYLRRVPGSAKAYFLCGVLHDANGQPLLAAESFRKALYLDPSHRGALLHLALKREALGDRSGAQLLRARALRAPEGDAAE